MGTTLDRVPEIIIVKEEPGGLGSSAKTNPIRDQQQKPICNGQYLPAEIPQRESVGERQFVDIGLFTRLSGIEPSVLQDAPMLFREMKESMAENLVLKSLSPQFEESLCYWYWSMTKPQTEVDFLASLGRIVVPIEVKASTNINSPSLRVFMDKYGEQIPLRVRFSMQNLNLNGNLLNIPLFMVDEAKRLMLLALEKPKASFSDNVTQMKAVCGPGD